MILTIDFNDSMEGSPDLKRFIVLSPPFLHDHGRHTYQGCTTLTSPTLRPTLGLPRLPFRFTVPCPLGFSCGKVSRVGPGTDPGFQLKDQPKSPLVESSVTPCSVLILISRDLLKGSWVCREVSSCPNFPVRRVGVNEYSSVFETH